MCGLLSVVSQSNPSPALLQFKFPSVSGPLTDLEELPDGLPVLCLGHLLEDLLGEFGEVLRRPARHIHCSARASHAYECAQIDSVDPLVFFVGSMLDITNTRVFFDFYIGDQIQTFCRDFILEERTFSKKQRLLRRSSSQLKPSNRFSHCLFWVHNLSRCSSLCTCNP